MASSRLSPARRVALSILDEVRRRDGYARDVMDASPDLRALDARDAGLARRLVLGTTAAEGCLDELLDRFLARPRKVAPRVRIALRLSTFELLYRDVPAEVAVSQGVELARLAGRGATGLANAVLRKVAAARAGYLGAQDVCAADRGLVRLARAAGLPVWLASEISGSRGTAALDSLAAAELEPAPNAAHANALGALDAVLRGPAPSPDAVAAEEGRPEASACPLPGCIAPADIRSLVASGAFARADAVASDVHAQLIATAATRPGSCLEIGAGRGTKSYVMASQAVRAGYARAHVALDLYEAKCRQNTERIERAGLPGVTAVAGDARDLDTALLGWDGTASGGRYLFDTVFVDAPCSGTGTMRRHPEIPWRLTSKDVNRDLPELQFALLTQAAARVSPGGELLYATCSVLRQENEAVVDDFLSAPQGVGFKLVPLSEAEIFRHPAFKQDAAIIKEHETDGGFFQTVPAPGAYDGHFCARLVKVI